MAASWSYTNVWTDGQILTHTDLNQNFADIQANCAVASGIATLDTSTLVVQDPANATATKAAGKICKWGASEAFQCSALTATTIAGTTGDFSDQITSTVTTGTAPFVVASTTQVANLNVATAGAATTATTATQVTDSVNNIRIKIINIGDWDMDADATVSVTHSLTYANIRSVSVFIRNDADNAVIPLVVAQAYTDTEGYFYYDSSNVVLYRRGSGYFDGVNYDSTSYNRGWVTVTYVA